jgi:hypothetical protein
VVDARIDVGLPEKLRVKRLAAPMLMTAAGASAPMAIAAYAKPANPLGKSALKSAGTTSLLLESLRSAAWPM